MMVMVRPDLFASTTRAIKSTVSSEKSGNRQTPAPEPVAAQLGGTPLSPVAQANTATE
jgi:hypothetical protein